MTIQRFLTLMTALTLAAVAVVGFVDALRDDRVDSAVLFAALLVGVLLLAGLRIATHPVVLRRDLAAWIDRTSAVTGESPETLTNRAVSRLRAGFTGRAEADE